MSRDLTDAGDPGDGDGPDVSGTVVTARAVLEVEPVAGGVVLVVTGSSGELYRSVVTAHAVGRGAEPGRGASQDELEVQADGELVAAGWVRASAWVVRPSPSGARSVTAPVTARPRVAITDHDRRVLEGLDRLTTMARGPVTAAALVPHVAPTWQAAAVLLRRLVAAGQVRAVGRTTEHRISRNLYAVVGSRWAPDQVLPPPAT